MTERENQLHYCQICLNRSFDSKQGIICGITNKKATFQTTCPDFSPDEKETTLIEQTNKIAAKEDAKEVNNARTTLFVITGLYILIGIYEAFIMSEHALIFGVIDWIVAGIFLGLALFSFKQPFTALLSGLIVYVTILLLLALTDPSTLFHGIIWKLAIIYYLIMGIKISRNMESRKTDAFKSDLLDE